MKTQLLFIALFTAIFTIQLQGQNRTIINAQNSEISDNLDLRIVASIFGDSRDLQDFERRLNDPQLRISNLDLNFDGLVDYLRVIETVERNAHIVIIQSVLDRDVYQDIATIEVNKNWINNITVQVVGNSFFYGQNYIYEPVYYNRPIIYNNFWRSNYIPYYSNWNWNYYPTHFQSWNTYSIVHYRSNVNVCLNNYNYNRYNYVSQSRSIYYSNNFIRTRYNEFELQHPDYSFSSRNNSVNNRYELDKIRYNQNNYSTNNYRNSERRSYNSNNNYKERTTDQRNYSQNNSSPNRTETVQKEYTRSNTETNTTKSPQREYTRTNTETTTPRENTQRQYTTQTRESSTSRSSTTNENSYSTRSGGRR